MALSDSAVFISVMKDDIFRARCVLIATKLGADVQAVSGGALPADTDQSPSANTIGCRLYLARQAILGKLPTEVLAAQCVLDAAVQTAILTDQSNSAIQATDVQLYAALRKAWTNMALASF